MLDYLQFIVFANIWCEKNELSSSNSLDAHCPTNNPNHRIKSEQEQMQRYRHSTVCLAVGNLSVSGTVTWHMPWQARFQCGESDYFWDSVHSYWRENAAQFLSHKMFARKLSCKTCQNFLSFTVFWDSVLTPGARKLSYKTCQNFLFSTAFLDSVLMPGARCQKTILQNLPKLSVFYCILGQCTDAR